MADADADLSLFCSRLLTSSGIGSARDVSALDRRSAWSWTARALNRWPHAWPRDNTIASTNSLPTASGAMSRSGWNARQADRMVGGEDAFLVIVDIALPKKGGAFSRGRSAICFNAGQESQLPNAGIADTGSRGCASKGVISIRVDNSPPSSASIGRQADPGRLEQRAARSHLTC